MNNNNLRVDWPAFVNWFNLTLKQYGSVVPPITYLTKGKRAHLQRIVNQMGTKKVLFDAVINMARSDFLNGRTRTKVAPQGFVASFPWLVHSDENIVDVANGKFNNPPPVELTPEEQRQLELERYRALQDARRAEARRIEEEESARREAARDYAARHCVTYEQYLRMKEKEANS